MAEHNYNGYKCLRCEKPLEGQKRKWCNTKCQKPIKEGNCLRCNAKLLIGRRLWCSDTCKDKAKSKTGLSFKDWTKHKNATAHRSYCKWCMVQFRSKPKDQQKYCSIDCKCNHVNKVSKEKKALRRIANNNKPYVEPVPKVIKEKAVKARQYKLCVICNTNRAMNNGKSNCCENCKDSYVIKQKEKQRETARLYRKTDTYKVHKRKGKAKRRALIRGATLTERIDPFNIFDRDGWTCQICGVKTPKAMRGKNKSNSPELDHIVPLSKGGNHVINNLQCLCRSCNGLKSDKYVIGQMGLFNEAYY